MDWVTRKCQSKKPDDEEEERNEDGQSHGHDSRRVHMVFPHLRETFYSSKVEHDDIRPNETTTFKEFDKLTINAIEGIEVKGEDARAMVRPMSPRAAPKNWIATKIPTIFRLS